MVFADNHFTVSPLYQQAVKMLHLQNTDFGSHSCTSVLILFKQVQCGLAAV